MRKTVIVTRPKNWPFSTIKAYQLLNHLNEQQEEEWTRVLIKGEPVNPNYELSDGTEIEVE